MMLKSTILPSVLGFSLLAVAGTAKAAPIDLTALGLETAPAAFATEAATTSLFGGLAFSSDTFAAAVTYNIAVSGSLPFGGTDFAISAFPVAGTGTLTGTSSQIGWDVDLVQGLLTISANTGVFSGVSPVSLPRSAAPSGRTHWALAGGRRRSATLCHPR